MPDGVVEHVADAFPVDLAVLGAEAVTAFARSAVDAARDLGLGAAAVVQLPEADCGAPAGAPTLNSKPSPASV